MNHAHMPFQWYAPVRYRACELCAHGGHGADVCRHDEYSTEPCITVASLRAPGGACGPEANGLAIPGLEG